MNSGTYGIDLGAAYTKVAYRAPFAEHEDPARPGFRQVETQVMLFHSEPLAPSLVIRAQGQWICGREAAGLNPAASSVVYRNWKSAFFEQNRGDRATGVNDVPTAYFAWLLEQLRKAHRAPSADSTVRIAIPAFDDVEMAKASVSQCVKSAGWRSVVEFIPEPEANVLGCFTGGRNCITHVDSLSYGAMFRRNFDSEGARCPGLIYDFVRDFHIDGRRGGQLTLAVVDCGGYTLDVALVQVDPNVTNHRGLPTQVTFKKSYELGVSGKIDIPCFGQLFARHRVPERAVAFDAMELAKRDLYQGRSHRLLVGDRTVLLGESAADREVVNAAIGAYIDVMTRHLATLPNIDAAILTGGGVSIVPIHDALQGTFAGKRVISLPAEAEIGGGRAAAKLVSCRAVEDNFGRVATAVGAASVAAGTNGLSARS